MPNASRDQRVIVLVVGKRNEFVCSPRPYMFALDGSDVLRRRYWGSNMSGWEFVEKRTSDVEVRKIVKVKGDVV